MQKKKGISLIVLVITIIVMIILAATIIISINNTNVIEKANSAVSLNDENELQSLASLHWSEGYTNGKRTQEELNKYVLEKLKQDNINIEEYGITVTKRGVDVVKSVIDKVDGVPIPKGFVASKATGENQKSKGLVIYEGQEEVTDENVEIAKRTRNQFVWVPVENFANFKRIDFNGKNQYTNDELGIDTQWELVLNDSNMPQEGQCIQYSQYISNETEEEAIQMYQSVKKYKGFYIARYETGIEGDIDPYTLARNSPTTEIVPLVQINKVPYFMDKMDNIIKVSRNFYPSNNKNYGVASTLMYGVQFDSLISWIKEGGVNIDDKAIGNNLDVEINKSNVNEGTKYSLYNSDEYKLITTQEKTSNTIWYLTTGGMKEDCYNNICDLAGNAIDMTMTKYKNNLPMSIGSNAYTVGKKIYRKTYWESLGSYHVARICLYVK